MGVRRVAKILCARDGISMEEAIERIEQTREEMAECEYAPFECEDIMMSNLGLEMDYIFDIL